MPILCMGIMLAADVEFDEKAGEYVISNPIGPIKVLRPADGNATAKIKIDRFHVVMMLLGRLART